MTGEDWHPGWEGFDATRLVVEEDGEKMAVGTAICQNCVRGRAGALPSGK
jgi:hypothetical protein